MPDANHDEIDWRRWRDLLDLRRERGLTADEDIEFRRITGIIIAAREAVTNEC